MTEPDWYARPADQNTHLAQVPTATAIARYRATQADWIRSSRRVLAGRIAAARQDGRSAGHIAGRARGQYHS